MSSVTRTGTPTAPDDVESASTDIPYIATAPGIRGGVIALGLVLSLFAFWLVVRMEQTDGTGLPTGLGIYFHVVVIFALLVIANSQLRRWKGSAMASRPELLCLYSMMSVGSSFACFEMLATQLDVISVPARWLALQPLQQPIAAVVLRLLPSWAILHDPNAAVQLFNGRHGQPVLWMPWILPLVAWGCILALTQLMSAAGCRLLQERWVHQEKLSFPLASLPLDISDPNSTIWRTPAFRITFGIMLALDFLNGMHQFFPPLPYINWKVTVINQFPPDPGWKAIGGIALTFHPLMIGLAFLLPTDLLFSCWFFYLIGKLQTYVAGALDLAHGNAFQFGGNFPGLIEQNTGAVLVFGIATLRNASKYLRSIWRDGLAGNRIVRRDIAILSVGAVIWAAVLKNLGLPWLLIPLFLIIAGLIGIVVTRLRAEMGLPVYNLHGQGPEMLLGVSLGPQEASLGALTGLMSMHGILRSQQGDVMPHQMEGAFMADRARAPMGRYWTAVTLAGAAAALIGPWIFVYAVSAHGLNAHSYNAFPEEGWRQLSAWAYSPTPPDIHAVRLVAVGAAVMTTLLTLRGVWPDSPFHPLGYAVCGVWGIAMIVVPIFIAWILKALVLRFGGLATYRKAVPIAYGLILGEFVAAVFWAVLSIVLHVSTYRVWLF